ncbi:hypothetical protein TNCV_4624501 [Trichonephila clavipes]|nr:hypothetical protein TNCV_4624501 [Trichonephila clavipes]
MKSGPNIMIDAGYDVQIKVNDRVLIKTHPLSSATKKVVAKFKPKFEGLYRVLEVKHNNLVIWKSGERSPPGSWSEPNRKLKMGRKETLAYKRSLDSGSGGPERKVRKDQDNEQKWSPDQPMRRHNKEDQFESEEAEIISAAPTSKSKQGQATGIPEAEVVNNRIDKRGKEERTATDPSP